jgi:hypothetical protein
MGIALLALLAVHGAGLGLNGPWQRKIKEHEFGKATQ